jgi:hypothetical protein
MEIGSLDAIFAVTAEQKLPELFTVEGRFRRALLVAEHDFVAGLVDDIRSGVFGGVAVWRRLHELRAQGVSFEEILRDPVAHLGEEARPLANVPPASGRQ